jgi:hypothetical protein
MGLATFLLAATISGSVTDTEGHFLSNSYICLNGSSTMPDTSQPFSQENSITRGCWQAFATTNELGQFSFTGMNVGYYTLWARHTGFLDRPYGNPFTLQNYVIKLMLMIRKWKVLVSR